MAYSTLADLKKHIGIPADDTEDDARLSSVLAAASESIDRYCGRTFDPYNTSSAAPRVFRTVRNCAEVDTDDFVKDDDTLVETGYRRNGPWTALEADDWDVLWPADRATDPHVGIWIVRPFDGWVRITARWGWTLNTPADIIEAALLLAARLYKRADAPFGVTGAGDLGVVQVRPWDPDVIRILGLYRKRKVG